jgi:predicted ArsR family transcriptional regulator
LPVSATSDGRTRDRVARLLLELGPSTATALGERLALSPAAIRRHLDAMVELGTITVRESRMPRRRGRGRPARLYALTDAGHAAGPTAYDELATQALEFLAEQAGEQAVEAFAAQRAEALVQRLSEQLAGEHEVESVALDSVASALTREGYAATAHPVPTGTQLCQHHCPVQSAAEQFPQLCEAETAALSRLLGTHVQRLATIAHGDGVCTTHVPDRSAATPSREVSI